MLDQNVDHKQYFDNNTVISSTVNATTAHEQVLANPENTKLFKYAKNSSLAMLMGYF